MIQREATDESVLVARAAQLARPLDEQRDEQVLDLLVLTVSGQRVAVSLEQVSEVRPPTTFARVPGAHELLPGLVGGRGDALAVVSLAALLGLAASTPPGEQWVTVLRDPAAPLGLLVDNALDIVSVGSNSLTEPPDDDGLVEAILDDGSLVLDTVALRRDPRLRLSASDTNEGAT